jgi:peptidoglycan LD-endopeptidase CwlK
MIDRVSANNIALMLPQLRSKLTNSLIKVNTALTGRAQVRIISTFRSFVEQSNLWKLGRSVVNPDGKSKARPFGYKVTNANAGDSIHNYRMAFDIVLVLDGKILSWDDVKDFDGDGKSDWLEAAHIFEADGWEWGGRWSSFLDKPHFQYTFGLTLKTIKARYAAKDFQPGTDFIRVDKREYVETYRTTTANVNMRTGASTSFAIIREIPKGSNIIWVKDVPNTNWSEVQFGNVKGFMNKSYLK